MAATLSLRVCTGASAGTVSAAQTGISFLSIDSAATDATTRQNNPIDVPGQSMEKWVKLQVDVAPATAVSNFLAWLSTTPPANTTLKGGFTATGATPVATVSTTATTDTTTWTSGAPATWDSGSYSAVGNATKFMVLQLNAAAGAAAGPITSQTYNYKYSET